MPGWLSQGCPRAVPGLCLGWLQHITMLVFNVECSCPGHCCIQVCIFCMSLMEHVVCAWGPPAGAHTEKKQFRDYSGCLHTYTRVQLHICMGGSCTYMFNDS